MKISPILTAGGALAFALCLGTTSASAEPWKFGVLSDTQWTGSPDDGKSPGTTPAGIIQQCDQAFIAQGVKFVIAVGDTVDTGSQVNMDIRALYAQDLYNAGIGFFPFRGNHESGWTGSAAEEARLYPQILNGGTNNLTPSDVLAANYGIDRLITNAAPTGAPFVIGANFSYPTNVNGTNINSFYGGLSYSFDYNNVRFVLIDQFENANPGGNLSSAPAQQPWIDQELADPSRPQHAFVFDHKNLLGGNHKDNIMGANINSSDPGDGVGVNFGALSAADQATLLAKEQAEDAFITSMATNKVHFYISGHDHHHYDSIVKSPLSGYSVHQTISASDSSKFYIPQLPVSTNDTPISQDLCKVGYYIYTVDGSRVTVDYYGVDMTTDPSFVVSSSTEVIITNTPVLTGRCAVVGGELRLGDLVGEQISDERDGLAIARIALHRACQLRESRRLRVHQPVQGQGLGRECGAQNELRETAQHIGQRGPFDQRHLGRRADMRNHLVHGGGKQGGLVLEAVIERALGDARARRDGFDGRRAVAVRQKQFRGGRENVLPQPQRIGFRRPAAAHGSAQARVGRPSRHPYLSWVTIMTGVSVTAAMTAPIACPVVRARRGVIRISRG